MNADPSCAEIRELAPELALGIASGDERALAMAHLGSCPECSRYLRELSDTADQILLLPPEEEPPAGFESRVLEGFEPHRARKRSRTWGALRVLAPAAVVGVLAVGLTLHYAYKDERHTASRYEATLSVAHGKYLSAEELQGPGGDRVGVVFGYEGEPSWVLVTVEPEEPLPPGKYTLQTLNEAGKPTEIRPIFIKGDHGSLGQAIPGHFHDVFDVRMIGPGKSQVYNAHFCHCGS